jgi:hypothetical protein
MTDGLRQGARGLAAARDGDRCSACVSEVGGQHTTLRQLRCEDSLLNFNSYVGQFKQTKIACKQGE